MIRRRTRKAITTNSKHNLRRYPNIIKGIEITGPNQVRPGRRAVSDMTYLALPRGFVYMSLVTDAYSRKIVGCRAAGEEEFSLDHTFFSYDQAKLLAKEAIEYYNQTRPHASCNYPTPN